MSIAAIDRRLSFKMFVKGLGQKLQDILGRSLPPEQKLELILEQMAEDVQSKRKTARELRARMVALSDPENDTLEPMERLHARRKKLVEVGATVLKQQELASDEATKATLSAHLGQLTQEVKAVSTSLSSMESTHQTLKESYEIALETYKVSLAAYERTKDNGPTLLLALKAHQEALQLRDNARKPKATVDASFLDDLTQELDRSQKEVQSDNAIDRELDALKPDVHPLMAESDRQEVDEKILQEFRGN